MSSKNATGPQVDQNREDDGRISQDTATPTAGTNQADTQRVFMVNAIKQTNDVSVLGQSVPLQFSELAKGCIGVSLWFDSLEAAVEYNGSPDGISEAQVSDLAKNGEGLK